MGAGTHALGDGGAAPPAPAHLQAVAVLTNAEAQAATRTIAAFDLDGTLTPPRHHDRLPRAQRGRQQLVGTAGRQWYSLLRAATSSGHRDPAKAAFLASLLGGMDAAEVAAAGESFAADIAANRLRPWAKSRLEWHRDRGHELVMISASLDIYVTPLAALLGFDRAFSTRLEVEDGRITGQLLGANVRGAEKARLLRLHLAEQPARIWAYGNSSGDLDMLALADVPVFVRRRGQLPSLPVGEG